MENSRRSDISKVDDHRAVVEVGADQTGGGVSDPIY